MRDKIISSMLFLLTAILFVLVLANFGFFDLEKMTKGSLNLNVFIRESFPPDLRGLSGAGSAILETIQMSFAGTLLGFLISLPLAVLSARNLAPAWYARAGRFVTAVLRTVPPLLWGIIFVIIAGLGPLAGTLSLALYTVGYLAKLYCEIFEGTDPEVMEAVRSTGATTPFLVRYAVFPEGANAIFSQLLFMFEYNIRASSILGFVGAGGIGFQIYAYLQSMEYQKLTGVLILILFFVLSIDVLGGFLRRRFFLAAS